MNAKQLLAHFDRISDTPDAVARLRRFVLDLAARGKLVAQLLSEGNAIPKPLLAPSEEDLFETPSSWSWVRVAEVADCRLGKMLDKAKNRGTARRYLRNINVRWFDFDLSDVLEMPFEDSELEEFSLRGGDVLICEGGEPGRAAVWDERESGIYFQKAIHRARFSASVSPHFFVNMLRLFAQSGLLASYFTGTGIKHFTGRGLASFRFPLPPLAEQHRIVAKVDELMALCDRLEAAQKERESRRDRLVASALTRFNMSASEDSGIFPIDVRFHLDRLPRLATRAEHVAQLRKTVLGLAVRGRLVPQDTRDEPPRLDATNVVDVDLWRRIPDSWAWATINDLLIGDSRNGYSRRPDGAADGIPILRISAGTLRRDCIVAEEQHKLIGKVTSEERQQFALQPGDLLACRFNGNREFVGRLSLYLGYLDINPIYPDKLIRLRLASCALPALVRYFAQSDVVRADIESYCATTVGNWGISATNLKRTLIPLPPLAEQHRIVAKVDQLMALCDQLEAQLTAAQTQSRRLLEAVLHEALAPAA